MTVRTTESTSRFTPVEHLHLGNRLLRRRDVELKTGKSRSAIYAGISNGTFPAPVPIGDKSVAWLEEEVDAWIAARIQERNQSLGQAQSVNHQLGVSA